MPMFAAANFDPQANPHPESLISREGRTGISLSVLGDGSDLSADSLAMSAGRSARLVGIVDKSSFRQRIDAFLKLPDLATILSFIGNTT